MKKYLLAGVLVFLLAAILAMPLAAAEKESVKIKLPDGLYMYDSWISHAKGESVRFEKYFVVKNNTIYGQREAVKKFGFSKLNEMFAGNKKYKILLAGEKIGSIYISRIENEGDCDDGCIVYKEELFAKDIKQGPAYGRESVYLGRLGSAAKCLAVPEAYKEVKKKVYTTIPQEEVDKIAKLVKEKLFALIKDRKEITEYKLKPSELNEEYIELLDKISDLNGDLYLGIYRYIFKIEKGSRKFTPFLVFALEVAFSVKENNVYLITSDYDGEMALYGMLDFDGCGAEELFIEKMFSTEDTCSITKEIYKQKADSSWSLIKNIKD